MFEIKTIECEKYEKVEGSKNLVKCVGMITGQEAFDQLRDHLERFGMLPDEYFMQSHEPEMQRQLPDFNTAICQVDWGGSEGIYLDISLLYYENRERKFMNFATGKTLDESGDAFLKMSRIAAECSMMLNGRGSIVKVSENAYEQFKPEPEKDLVQTAPEPQSRGEENFSDILSKIDASKITDSARISVVWDSFGIAVDLDYTWSEKDGAGDGVLCFCENYGESSPDESVWEEAQNIGAFLKEKFGLPLTVSRDDQFLNQMAEKSEEKSDSHQQLLIDAVFGYLGEHLDSSELYSILHEDLEMSHEDIESLGFDLPQCQERPERKMMTPVSSWDHLKKRYPIDRDEMPQKMEEQFVEDCFHLYEKEGFSPVFWSPYSDFADRVGQQIEIIARCQADRNTDLSVLPMWRAKFPDGFVTEVHPEEVIPSEMRANGCRLFDEKKPAVDALIQSASLRATGLSGQHGPEQEHEL